MRSLLVALLAALAPTAALAQASPDPLATLNGRWVYVGYRDQQGLEQACKEHFEHYEVSADRRDIKTASAAKGPGKGYRVLYAEDNTAVMYLNDETRKLKASGDRLIWVLIIESADRFRWRIYSNPSDPEQEGKYARVRCPKG
jgi:hypothetical protein